MKYIKLQKITKKSSFAITKAYISLIKSNEHKKIKKSIKMKNVWKKILQKLKLTLNKYSIIREKNGWNENLLYI